MSVLKMLKVWDSEDGDSVLFDSTRYTAKGLTNYWLSVDSAIRFWDVAMYPKIGLATKKKNKPFNKYKWNKNPI